MIVFVDTEHESSRSKAHGERVLAARAWITYRLEELAGRACVLTRYDRVAELFADARPSNDSRSNDSRSNDCKAIFLSGNSAPPDAYDEAQLGELYAFLRAAEVPMFGFCGGMQFLARAFGASVEKLEQPSTDGPSGRMPEYGYGVVEITEPHPVLEGLGDRPVVRHAHGMHVPKVPEGFSVHGRTPMTPVQIMIHDDRRIVGTQFHPEYWTEEFPAGRIMIENFVRWARI